MRRTALVCGGALGHAWRAMAVVLRAIVFALCCACVLNVGGAYASCTPPPPPEAQDFGFAVEASTASNEETTLDRTGRVVAPVFVNGEGPFRFIVDTGANRSVLSWPLAYRLGLTEEEEGEVHSIDGVETAPFTGVESLTHGALSMQDVRLPILRGRVFAGEAGLLGVDGMAGRRLRMDLEDGCIEIVDARGAPRLRGNWITVRGELRFERLLLARARVGNVSIRVLIDTGADSSFGNLALREALIGVRGRRTDIDSYTAGDLLVLDQAVLIPELRMGELGVSNVLAYIGDYHIFNVWGLGDEPTLLLGMNVISQTREIAIDYERALLHFRLPDEERDGIGIDLRGGWH